jgi:hypothetical protein
MPNLMGHRDAMQYRPSDATECPGDALYAVLPGLRGDVAFNLPAAPAPAATILDVAYDRPAFLPGGTMTVTVKVKNTGNVTLSTQGPAGTLTYAESDSATSRGYGDHVGAWRVALDLPGGGAAADYPFRWGFAQPLEPGQTATITGRVTLNGPGKRSAAIGLVRESRYWSLRAASPTTITVIDPSTLRRRQVIPDVQR